MDFCPSRLVTRTNGLLHESVLKIRISSMSVSAKNMLTKKKDPEKHVLRFEIKLQFCNIGEAGRGVSKMINLADSMTTCGSLMLFLTG